MSSRYTEFDRKLSNIPTRDGYFQIRDAIYLNASGLSQKDFDEIELKIREVVESKGLTYNSSNRMSFQSSK